MAKEFAPILSDHMTAGFTTGHFNSHSEMIQESSDATSAIAQYSDSVEDRDTTFCLFDDHVTSEFPR